MFLLYILNQIALRNAAKLYMEMVDKSYLTSSDEVNTIYLYTKLIILFH